MKPFVLCILDGVGLRDETFGNAFYQANTPCFDELWKKYPHSKLIASGEKVGLPKGQMGNSEVGHMNIGAGRIVYQPLELIRHKIEDGSFFKNKNFLEVMHHVKEKKSKLHILGLLSDGGIHSHISHLFALIDMAKKEGVEDVYIHAFLDGRDTLPDQAIHYLHVLEEKLEEEGSGKIASIAGRFYAMDRDNRFDRVYKAYHTLTAGIVTIKTPSEVIEESYCAGVYDEFIEPTLFEEDGRIEDNDGMICFNYRPDRLRELFSALTNPSFEGFERKLLQDTKLVTMMPVSDEVITKNAYQLETLNNTLGEYLSSIGKTQLRIAETEKYAHVTYFFDGGVEKELEGCRRILVPSPKVTTYDLKPEMSAVEVTDQLLEEMNNFDIVILNYANGDMVGHTGDMDATIKAVETVDQSLKRVYNKVIELGGTLMVIADHGNCDMMKDKEGNIITSHTTSLVPLIITKQGFTLKDGKLGDVAPTILSLLNIDIPKEMTGENLVQQG